METFLAGRIVDMKPLPNGLAEQWAQFFSTDTEPRGRNVYEPIFSHPLLFPLQRRKELTFMMSTANVLNPRVVFEIGTAKGGGFYHWCKSLPTVKRAAACNINGTPYSQAFSAYFNAIEFLWLPQSSHDPKSLDAVTEWLDKDTIDCLFIDGDKFNSYKDFTTYQPLMSPDGIIFVHDVQDSIRPKAGYKRMLAHGHRHMEYVNTEESSTAMARERQGIRAANPHEQWLRHWRGHSCGVGVIWMN